MPAKTNSQHPQHVETQSAKIAAEIMPILSRCHDAECYYAVDSEIYPCICHVKGDAEKFATYVIDYRRNDWYSGYKQGYQAAKDGKAMTDKEAYDQLPEGHGARG